MRKEQVLQNQNLILRSLMIFCLATFTLGCGEENKETPLDEPGAEVEEGAEIGAVEWDYENTDWEETGDNECGSNVQSPVNIVTEDVIEARLADINFEYSPFNMTIVDNGHTVQVLGAQNNFITVEGEKYEFKQFHFHNPSEHNLDGKEFPLEVHLVHQGVGTDDLVVLGIFIEEGESNPFLEKVFTQIPSEEKVEKQTETSLNLLDVIPSDKTYYTYLGSLTTPPCTVGVDWKVYKQPISASAEQIKKFSDKYANTARPVQELDNRRVLKSME